MQIIKPSFSGLATGHPRYARLHRFYNFGANNRELVTDTALTVSGAALVDDPDIGDSRGFVTGATVTEQISLPQECTIIMVLAGRGTRVTGDPALAICGSSGAANKCYFGYNYSSGGRWTYGYRGATGTNRSPLYTNGYANDGEFATGHAVAAVFSATATMRAAVDGVSQPQTDVQTSENLGSNPLLMPFFPTIGANANFPVGAIIVLTGISTEAELVADTADPWAYLSEAPSITNIDGDDIITQGQQNITITVANIPTGMVPIRAGAGGTNGIGGNDFTGFVATPGGTAGSFTIECDVPIGIATSTSTQCYVEYAPE